jgi:hypothetical protein
MTKIAGTKPTSRRNETKLRLFTPRKSQAAHQQLIAHLDQSSHAGQELSHGNAEHERVNAQTNSNGVMSGVEGVENKEPNVLNEHATDADPLQPTGFCPASEDRKNG